MGSVIFTRTSSGIVGNRRGLAPGFRKSGGFNPGIPVFKGDVVAGVAVGVFLGVVAGVGDRGVVSWESWIKVDGQF
jgi:hypothetical protein